MKSKKFKQKILDYVSSNGIHNPFNDKLSILDIVDFEKKNNVVLPEEYKFFLNKIGNGGFGPGYGIFNLEETIVDFKLDSKPLIDLSKPFKYSKEWNPSWIKTFDWNNERPELDLVNKYMDVSHISGTLQISHYGHGCTYLIVINGKNKGEIWFDSRADYGGLIQEIDEKGNKFNFFDWYIDWLENKD